MNSRWNYMMPNGWNYMGFNWLGSLTSVIFWLLIILCVVALLRSLKDDDNHTNNKSEKDESALEILKLRYAKGEITKKEFDQMKKDLA